MTRTGSKACSAWNPATGLAQPYVHLMDNGYVSVDYYVRDGGDGTCMLP